MPPKRPSTASHHAPKRRYTTIPTNQVNAFLTHVDVASDIPEALREGSRQNESSAAIGRKSRKRALSQKRKLPDIHEGRKRRDLELQQHQGLQQNTSHVMHESQIPVMHMPAHAIAIVGSSQNGGIYKSHNLVQHQFHEALMNHMTERSAAHVRHQYEALLGSQASSDDAQNGQVEGFNPFVAVNLAMSQCLSSPECTDPLHPSGQMSPSFQYGLDLLHQARVVFLSEEKHRDAALCNLNEASIWMERAMITTKQSHKTRTHQKVDQLLWHAVELGEQVRDENDRTQILANIFGNLSETRYQRGDMDQAKSFALRAIEAFSHLDDSMNSAKMLRLFGLICYAQNNFKDACKYLELYAQTECENAFKYQYHSEQFQQGSYAENSLQTERSRPPTASSGASTRVPQSARRKSSRRSASKPTASFSLDNNPYFQKNIQRIMDTFCVLEDAHIQQENYEAALLTSERAKTFRFVLESKMHFNHHFSWENMTSILNNIEKHILFYSMTMDYLRIWLVVPLGEHRHKIVFHNVRIADALEQCAVKDPFELLAGMMDLGNSVRFDPNQHLYALLIEPVEADLPQSPTEPVLIVPHWDFTICPFGALRNPRTKRYFIEDHAYSVYSCFQLISMNMLKIQKRDQDRAAIQRILKLSETSMESSEALEVLIITGLISEQRISITLQEQHDVVTSFVHSLLAAKIPTVIATLWNIDSVSNAVKTFEKVFYSELERGERRLSAMRKAVLEVMNVIERERSWVWGAFQMFGVYE